MLLRTKQCAKHDTLTVGLSLHSHVHLSLSSFIITSLLATFYEWILVNVLWQWQKLMPKITDTINPTSQLLLATTVHHLTNQNRKDMAIFPLS